MEIFNSFHLYKELIKIPHFISIVDVYCRNNINFMFSWIYIGFNLLVLNWDITENNQKISIISSILECFTDLVNKLNFMNIIHLEELYNSFGVIVMKGSELPGEYPDLIKSIFESSGWIELLIDIFNCLNPFSSSSSSKILPLSLSFLSSICPSEETVRIVRDVANTLKILLGKKTPNIINKYLKLITFE
jgi:hypothetical protein